MLCSLFDMEDDVTALEFGYFLKNMRDLLDCRMSDISKVLGIPVSRYSRYEAGDELPKDWLKIQNKVYIELKKKYESDPWSRYNWRTVLTDEDFERMEEYALRGYNVVKISMKLGIPEEYVKKYLKSVGISVGSFNPHMDVR